MTPCERSADQATRHLVLIGGLMVLVIALLAVLWARERRRRVRAEGALADARLQLEVLRQTGGAGGWARPEPGPTLRRDRLPAEAAELNGRPVTLLRLDADLARRLGLRPGDLLAVSPPTRPATRPASRPRTTAP
jgi:hypothetical protein